MSAIKTATLAYLTTKEAAALLRMQPQSMRRWRWAGGGPPFVKLSNRVLYRVADVEAWLAERTVTSTAAAGAR